MAKIGARRRSVLDNPEEVLTLAQHLLARLKVHKRWLALGLALAAVALAAWAIHTGMRMRQEDAAAAALARVGPRLAGETGSQAAQDLERLVRDYPGTQAAWEAQFLRANLLYHLKNYREAVQAYESLLPGSDPPWSALLNESLSYCYEGLGDYPKAAAALKAAAKEISGPLAGELDQRLALLLEKAGDYRGAAVYWKKLLEKPGNPALQPYLMERLKADEAREKK